MCEVVYGDAKVDASVSDRSKDRRCERCFGAERKWMKKNVGLVNTLRLVITH